MRSPIGHETGDAYGPWSSHSIVVIDLETTGFDVEVDRVVEIGLARFERGHLQERWGSLVHPRRLIPDYASRVHGIRNADIGNARPFISIIPQVVRIANNAWPCAFNEPFDRRFLRMEFELAGIDAATVPMLDPTYAWIDPLIWSKTLSPDTGNKLGEVCERYGIRRAQAHRAPDDAAAAGEILFAMKQQIGPQTMTELLRMQHMSDLVQAKNRERKKAVAEKMGLVLMACRQCGRDFNPEQLPRHWVNKYEQLTGDLFRQNDAKDAFWADSDPLCSEECGREMVRRLHEGRGNDEFKYVLETEVDLNPR